MNPITMQLVADKYIKMALEEDINSEDVSTNAVMPEYKKGDVQLICKEDGIIAGLQIFERVFTLLDEKTQVEFFVKDGEKVKKGQTLGIIEAMKLMNEIESEYDGVVKEILIENGQMAEYGQPLFVIG